MVEKVLKRLLVLAFLLTASTRLNAQLNVHIINVGQGDAIYIELPSGKNVLIDGGPKAAPLMDFLKQKGVVSLDNVVLTHPHLDHYTGLKAVLKTMDIKNFYDTKMDNLDAKVDNQIRETIAAKPGCAVHYPQAGEQLNWDPEVAVTVLHAVSEETGSANAEVINNSSIVLQLRYNGNNILLMGDAQADVENEIMGRFGAAIKSVILKVGHHGAPNATTPEFLAAVKPKYAYISVGLNNAFGHPAKDTLDNIMSANATILMTTEGTQSFSIPAPVTGLVFPPLPVLGSAFMTPFADFADMTLTWPPQDAGMTLPSPALEQLIGQAAASK